MTVTIGRSGLWVPLGLWLREGSGLQETAAELDELGFETIWLGNGPTIMDVASSVLDATQRVTVATGIANIWAHPVGTVAARQRAITERHPDRMLLGLGNGPREPSQWQLSPYRKMVEYLDELDDSGVPADRRILAASGPRMLTLAGERSLGAHPFLTTPEHTQEARSALSPRTLLAPELKVVLQTDPGEARAIARQALDFYLTKRGYRTTLRRLGYGEDDFAAGGSDRLVDAVVAWGDIETVLKRIAEHHQAGADHVAIQLLTWDTDAPTQERRRLPMEQLRILAQGLYQ